MEIPVSLPRNRMKEKGSREQAETSVCSCPGVPMVVLRKTVDGRLRALVAVWPKKPPCASEPQNVGSSPLPWRGLPVDSCCSRTWPQAQWLNTTSHDHTLVGVANTQVSLRAASKVDRAVPVTVLIFKPSPAAHSLNLLLPQTTSSALDFQA